ncbi:unnamed protein product [Toxocara canis]|uniref:CASPASE_P10 domain-containing protein n=1 Tax=Toxocara canis TaxID=6265 RepID=A0A183U151_TOXCA|nr:unnamed protein product [Toxocara canis]
MHSARDVYGLENNTIRMRNERKAFSETCDNSLQAMMEGRGTRQKKQVAAYPVCDNGGESQFCWWAIEVGNPRWKLYRNGMQPLIEYNIGPSCLDNNERHGFSFMNTTTTVLYNETAAKRFTKLSKSFQVIVDVFYFCCSSRSACDKFSKNLSDDQIINKLADQLLIYINVASDVRKGTNGTMCKKGDGRPMARLPGVDVCVFVAHASSKAKVYTGPMLFNRFNLMTKVPAQGEVSLPSLALKRRLCISHVPGNDDYAEHLKDGECWRYLSQDEYLLFCCCYESDHWCRYSADHSKDSIWKYNARYWPTNSELRAVYDVPFYDRTVTAKEWNYRDFVYSRPCKSHSFLYVPKVE